MKRKILSLMLVTTVISALSISAYASETKNTAEEYKEVITNQRIVYETNEDGSVSQVGLVTIENQPTTSDLTKAGCLSGSHQNVVNNGTPETTRYHGTAHPGYCTVKTTTYWRCTACNTTGHDDEYTLVWCPSKDISGDVGQEGPGEM